MKTFNLYRDVKSTIWNREYYSIDAESEEEAIDKILNGEVEIDDNELLYETEECMSPDENYGFSTVEIYNNATGDLIYTNSHA